MSLTGMALGFLAFFTEKLIHHPLFRFGNFDSSVLQKWHNDNIST